MGSRGCTTKNAPAAGRFFPPAVALSVVKLACARPAVAGRSLSQWESAELARQLVRDGVVEASSPQTVQRMLAHHTLKPWRHHLWRSPHVPRDAAFAAQVQEIVTWYTRPLGSGKCVVRRRETRLQPRTRKAPTLAAQPGQPVRVEHAYTRKGALNLFAGFDTRTGTVYATTAERKRQGECIAFLEQGDREVTPAITRSHIVLDHIRRHKGKKVQAWLATPPRFVLHLATRALLLDESGRAVVLDLATHTLAYCRLCGQKALAQRLMAFVAEWNDHAHPFQWSTTSVAKVMAKYENPMVKAA